ncbi:DUF2752 domain-containing protein [Hymenobacter lutimineralis]|uniref:DUF2752 domain-containing protein n=1 Tax=Hymenobacter lutimineralis TaxID=2606448 RepID=A0A5D6UZU8_9BACT|nr:MULTISPECIES: DUF2752 domain-containing protein [Hymenobacter]QIX60687.1 DUF2752 domain-containing protein [Hymenobacter sp. BT18]TYZ08670.1 DUF2752 domain-containing protein [Hymenobacter lutimineralis]
MIVGSGIIWLTLLVLPGSFFDHGQSVCLSQLLLHQACPACGITRACMHALHLNWQQAWHYNRLVVIVLPLLAWLWGQEVWVNMQRLGWVPPPRSEE